jgi:hypothetical protein
MLIHVVEIQLCNSFALSFIITYHLSWPILDTCKKNKKNLSWLGDNPIDTKRLVRIKVPIQDWPSYHVPLKSIFSWFFLCHPAILFKSWLRLKVLQLRLPHPGWTSETNVFGSRRLDFPSILAIYIYIMQNIYIYYAKNIYVYIMYNIYICIYIIILV